jgi:Chaperone of endosialidase
MANKQFLIPMGSSPGSGGGGAVSSVFGRTGAVVAVAGDYTWNQLGNATGNLTLANAAFTTTFDQTAATVWTWANTTTATVGTTNGSPVLTIGSNYWTGAASAADTWTIKSTLTAGATSASTLALSHPAGSSTAKVAVSSNVSTTANAVGILLNNGGMAFAATSGTQHGVQVNQSFSAASGTASFNALEVDLSVGGSGTGNLTGLSVALTGDEAYGGNSFGLQISGDGGTYFQVQAASGAGSTNIGGVLNLGSSLGTASLADNTSSTGGAHRVLTAGASGSNVVWDTAGVSAGPLTPTSMTTVAGLVTAFTGTSDARLKDYSPYTGGLAEILQITPARYTWNAKGQKHTGLSGTQEFVGFIAQDVQAAIPEAITAKESSKDGTETYLSFDDRPVIAALVNAVKTLEARIKELEARLYGKRIK